MESLLEGLYALPVAEWMRQSRWGYASVNAAHVLGISLVVGAITPLNLRLLGVWRSVDLAPLARVLPAVAAFGLALALISGTLLFITRAPEYAAVPLFQIKLSLVAAGTIHALLSHRRGIVGMEPSRRFVAGIASLSLWVAVLVCGRMLAFVDA